MKTLENIRFVILKKASCLRSETPLPALKTMGLSNLHLVEPLLYPSAEATARASGADDILARSIVHSSLDAALVGCQQVYGMSARLRHLPVPVLNPREAVNQIQHSSDDAQIAIVFGREHSGLSNDELDRCQHLINIPANSDYSSLNLAAAVQVFAYELKMSFDPTIQIGRIDENRESISADDMEYLYTHFEQALMTIGFLDPDKPRKLMRRLRRLFNRAELDRNELQILHGILRAAETNRGQS